MSAARQQPRTSPGKPKHFILPEGIVSTGFPSVQATCRKIGIEFDPWQVDLNRAVLGKDRFGLYAADTVVMSICRQAGKTFNVGALVFADSIINPGTTTIWTAHRFKVSRETFDEMRALARSPLLAPHIDYDKITTGAGNETIPFRNGSRIVFAARERGAIRGFTKVERLVLDEVQFLKESEMSDLAPTMNQARNPQIIMMGTPPTPVTPGEVFTQLRKDALSGESEDLLYIEYAADPTAPVDVTRDGFWDHVAQANPSFPERTTKRAIRRLRRLLTNDDDFRREALGIWEAASKSTVFEYGVWEAGQREARPIDLGVDALAIATSIDGSMSSIVAAAVDGEEIWLKPLRYGPGTSWVVEEALDLLDEYQVELVVDSKGPAAVLIPELESEGAFLRIASTDNVLDACAKFEEAVKSGRVRYEPAEELTNAVAVAVKRAVGDRWAWGRRKAAGDISPLEGATLAAWAAGEPLVSAYESEESFSVMVF